MSILQEGLIGGKCKGLCGWDKDRRQYQTDQIVWLTPDPIYILENQAGAEWYKRHTAQIIKVEIDASDAYPALYRAWYPPRLSTKEFMYTGIIPPSSIVWIKSVNDIWREYDQ